MATTYKFQIGNDTIPYSESLTATIDNTGYDISLLSLRYHKKMYQPGLIEAKLQLKQNNTSATKKVPDMSKLVDYFKSKSAYLSKTVDSTEVVIAEDYYVYQVTPEYKRGEKGQYVVISLQIYSPDHKLTLDKYCRSYTNRKLATDVLVGGVSKSDNPLSKAGFSASNVDTNHLKFLNFIYDIENNDVTYREFVQPYLVQYNESFFDFLARTANRCGEFLYYEQGKLFLGINDFKNIPSSLTSALDRSSYVDIDRDTVISYSFQQAVDSIVDTANYYYNSLNAKTNNDNTFSYNNELPLNEYLGNIVTKDEYTETIKEFFPKALKTIPEVLESLSTGGISGLIGWAVPTILMGTLFAESTAKAKNTLYNNTWVNVTEPTKNKNNYTERYYDGKATLYGTQMSQAVKQKNYVYSQDLNDVLYNFISKCSRTVSQGLIDINIGVEQVPFLLGQSVTFESGADITEQKKDKKTTDSLNLSRYVVIDVNEVIKAEERYIAYDEWQLGQKVTIAPLCNINTTKYNDSTNINFAVACPPIMCPHIRTSGTQRAFVAEKDDPKGFGRVRIKYPWQTTTDDNSPFIRMAVPYAPETSENGGGFYFQPREGTEVLIDYENGNIERPFVIGSLFNAQAKAPHDGATFTANWTPSLHPDLPSEPLMISSLKGHKIKLDDNGNAEDFLMSALPAVDLFKFGWKLLPKGCRIDQGGNSCFSGGITLTDKWGLYKIDCSTTNRSISINSPFGDVKLTAFTGISINAPNGDININGKNVTIQAGNELKLLSGTKINKPEHEFWRDTFLKGITGALTDIALKAIDLRLLRTTLEIFLSPIAGTMTIKSNRYLLLGAGLGKPEIPSKGYSVKGISHLESVNDRIQLVKQITTMGVNVDRHYEEIFTNYKAIRDAFPAMQEYIKGDQWDTWRGNFIKSNLTDSPATLNKEGLPLKDELAEDKQTDALNKANDIQQKLVDILKSCNKYFKEGENLAIKSHSKLLQKDNYEKVTKKCAPKTQIPIVKDILSKTETFKLTDPALETAKADVKAAKRYFVYQFVKETYSVEYADAKISEPRFNSLDDFKDERAWTTWVNGLHRWTGKSVKTGGAVVRFLKEVKDEALDKAKNYTGYNTYKEKDLWGVGQKGEILMADKDNACTMSFQNGAVIRNQNTDGYTSEVKKILFGM